MKRSSCNTVYDFPSRALLSLIVCAVSVFSLSLPAATLVSQSPFTNNAASGESQAGALSSDGRLVILLSEANNLVWNDDNGRYWDLFARDLATGETTLLSIDRSGYGGGNGNSAYPSVSTDRKWVAFHSAASNLTSGDTNGLDDVFVRDLSSATTKLISQNQQHTGSGAGPSRFARISGNGRFVVFESLADDLVANDSNHTNDVFVHDLTTGSNRLVSATPDQVSGNAGSDSAVITPDGRYVAFVSRASDLLGTPGSTNAEVYLRDLQSNHTVWASSNISSYFSNTLYRCLAPAISPDGRVVVFKAAAIATPRSLPNGRALVFRFEMESGTAILLGSNSIPASLPQLSADGRFVAFEDGNSVVRFDAAMNTTEAVPFSSDSNAQPSANTPIMSPDGAFIAFLGSTTNVVNYGLPVTQLYLRDMLAGRTELISTTTNGAPVSTSLAATVPFVSDDGQMVLFDSADPALVSNDWNLASDVFLRDRDLQRTMLISGREGTLQGVSGARSSSLRPGSLSSNGQFVAFASGDNNLVQGDTNHAQDVFVSDLTLRATVSASLGLPGNTGVDWKGDPTNFVGKEAVLSGNGKVVAFTRTDGVRFPSTRDVYARNLETSGISLVSQRMTNSILPTASGASGNAVINHDGSLIAFECNADQVTPYPWNFKQEICLRRGGTNYLVSINAARTGNGNDQSRTPSLSPDGRWVLFYSLATDLTTNVVSGSFYRLFAHDLAAGQTRLLNFDPSWNTLNESITGAVFSANSRYVAFQSTNSGTLYRFDVLSSDNVSEFVAPAASNPSVSADGRLVAYESPGDATGRLQLYMKDMETASVTLISANRTNGPGNDHSRWPQIAPNGRFIVFSSRASDLVDNDNNNTQDVFMRDLSSGVTTLLSRNLQGTGSANAMSSRAFISADSRTIVFQSFAKDIVPHDYDSAREIFVVHVGSGDSDGDGLDDDWELAYFNTLNRDGTGDFDNDGKTDREEFLAGTDPTNVGSVLRVLTISKGSNGPVTLVWSAISGKSYRAEFKDAVQASEWQLLQDNIKANGSTASIIDESSATSTQRFYRIIVLE